MWGDGSPLRQQELRFSLPRASETSTRTASGRFVVNNVDNGDWRVIGRLDAGDRHAERRVTISGRSAAVDLEFDRLARVSGIVKLDGQAARSVRLLLIPDSEPADGRSTWTRHDGVFAFGDVERGNYRLGVGASLRKLSVNGDKHLHIELGSGRVGGLVADPDTSVPAPGAEVRLWPALATRAEAERLGILRRTYADRKGTFTFDDVPEGAWAIEVAARAESGRTVQVGAGSETRLHFH